MVTGRSPVIIKHWFTGNFPMPMPLQSPAYAYVQPVCNTSTSLEQLYIKGLVHNHLVLKWLAMYIILVMKGQMTTSNIYTIYAIKASEISLKLSDSFTMPHKKSVLQVTSQFQKITTAISVWSSLPWSHGPTLFKESIDFKICLARLSWESPYGRNIGGKEFCEIGRWMMCFF